MSSVSFDAQLPSGDQNEQYDTPFMSDKFEEPGTKLDAGDRLILERLAHIEHLLQTHSSPASAATPVSFKSEFLSPSASNSAIDDAISQKYSRGGSLETNADRADSTVDANISTMPEKHTTPAMNLLLWPKIRELVSRPYDSQVLLQLEMTRRPLKLPDFPRLDMTNSATFAAAYFELANPWYACVNPYSWKSYYRLGASVGFGQGPESCVILLTLALGHAAKSGNLAVQPQDQDAPGLDYFAAAWKIMPGLMVRNDILATQCHILAAAYLFYLVRPLEAWTLLSNASTKLQLLLNKSVVLKPAEKELRGRLFWGALLGQSDMLAELDLPHSGLLKFEDTIDLPRPFVDTGDEATGEDSIWFFLGQITLRRLLNRVSHLIYTTTATADPPTPKVERIVSELEFQLEQFYEGLPSPIKFPPGRIPAATRQQTALRLRYHACRTIIFRTYVFAVLADENTVRDPVVREKCRKCLESCMFQIEEAPVQ
ncbi:hypothetical protein MBLNU459_g5936t2 [Dothideomycetes sp. NU459]